MAKQPSRKRAAAEEYDSDDGFVEDVPKSKKSKSNTKAPVSYAMKRDDDGNEYWDISGKRRLQVSQFKGNTMIGIREFYEKDGKMLPGKKGISLNLDQFNTFVELLPQIEDVLKSKGVDVPRPQYDGSTSKTKPVKDVAEEEAEEDDNEDEEEEEEPPKQEKPKSKSKLDKFRLKANHEATSDEDNA